MSNTNLISEETITRQLNSEQSLLRVHYQEYLQKVWEIVFKNVSIDLNAPIDCSMKYVAKKTASIYNNWFFDEMYTLKQDDQVCCYVICLLTVSDDIFYIVTPSKPKHTQDSWEFTGEFTVVPPQYNFEFTTTFLS